MDNKVLKKFNTLVNNALKTWNEADLKECMRMYVEAKSNGDEENSDESQSNSSRKYEDNLALFSKIIGDVRNISPCILFYTSNDNLKGNSLVCHCVICMKEIRMTIDPSVNTYSLKRHLGTAHGYLGTLVCNNFEKMGSLLKDVPRDIFSTRKEDSSREYTTAITDYAHISKQPITQEEVEMENIIEEEEEYPSIIEGSRRSDYCITRHYSPKDKKIFL